VKIQLIIRTLHIVVVTVMLFASVPVVGAQVSTTTSRNTIEAAEMTMILSDILIPPDTSSTPFAGEGQDQNEVKTVPVDRSRLDEILARGSLRVGLSGDYRPFSIVVGSTMEGLEVDMATSLAKSLGVKLELIRFAWPTLMQDLAANKFDIAMGGISINLQRQRIAYFSVPVMHGGKTPITRCTDKEKYQTLSEIDRPGVRVIEPPGGTNETFARANLHQAHIEVFPNNATIFDQIVNGNADVMITDAVETRTQQKLHKELCAVHPDQPFNTTDLAYLLPRDLTWKAYVDQWLNIMNQTGERKQLMAKWLE
jgi:cyclohexadienyl dehydratase